MLHFCTVGENFDSKNVGLRIQKKLLSSMASKSVAKVFIDETSGRILDNLFRIARSYSGSKHVAEKLIKNMIKIVIKIGILQKNEQFNNEEQMFIANFRKKFRHTCMTIMSFYEVDFTYDRNFLAKCFNECRDILKKLVQRHLTDKSLNRIDHVCDFYSNLEFLDTLFKTNDPYRELLGKIVADLNKLFDDGIF